MSPLTITTIQSDLHWQDKQANLSMFEEKIRAIRENPEIIILPEMFSTGFSMDPAPLAETMEGDTINWMKRLAREKKSIITGSMIAAENGHYYNRLVWMLPNGQFGYYDKRHLFAFAGEDERYSPGNKRLIASVKGWRLNLLVCYDLRFPVWSRQSATENGEAEFDLLMYVANWPERRSHAWKTLLPARAIENQAYTIGLNRVGTDGNGHYYSGDSMVIDPLGEILYEKSREEDVHTIQLDPDKLKETRKKFPFLLDADHFTILS